MEALKEWLIDTPLVAYLSILIMTGIVYKVAFARQLPILKSLVVYFTLAIGCALFWLMFMLGFPIMEILLVTLVIIVLARFRMGKGKKEEKTSP